MPSIKKCLQCGGDNLFKCGRCGIISYCGSACQKKNWPSHKRYCSLLTMNDSDLFNHLRAKIELYKQSDLYSLIELSMAASDYAVLFHYNFLRDSIMSAELVKAESSVRLTLFDYVRHINLHSP